MKKRAITISLLAVFLILSILFFWFTCDVEKEEGNEKGEAVTVSFETYVDTKVNSQKIAKDSYAIEPQVTLKRAGYTFVGWYDGQKKWDFERDRVTKSITLTAKWEKYLSFVEATDGSGGVWVAGCNFDIEEVVIPDTYNGKRVTGIHWAFATRDKIKSIVIPDTVTYISANAFNRCASLESIVIPASVTKIEEGAFSLCDSLREIKCEADKMPNGWHKDFNKTEATVVFDGEKDSE